MFSEPLSTTAVLSTRPKCRWAAQALLCWLIPGPLPGPTFDLSSPMSGPCKKTIVLLTGRFLLTPVGKSLFLTPGNEMVLGGNPHLVSSSSASCISSYCTICLSQVAAADQDVWVIRPQHPPGVSDQHYSDTIQLVVFSSSFHHPPRFTSALILPVAFIQSGHHFLDSCIRWTRLPPEQERDPSCDQVYG